MDIIDQILEKIKPLQNPYDKYIVYFHDENEIEIKIEAKFSALEMALKSCMKSNTFKIDDLKRVLDMIENFVQEADEKTQDMVEIMFLEGLNRWIGDEKQEASKKYGDYLLSFLGPTCRKLCKKNDDSWKEILTKEILTQRQQKIEEKYPQTQPNYAPEHQSKNNYLMN